METAIFSNSEAAALIVALLSLLVSLRAFNRSKDTEVFALKIDLLRKLEILRSAWYDVTRENSTLIHRVKLNQSMSPPLRDSLLEFLQEQQEVIEQSTLHAGKFAEDVQAQIGRFNAKKCREHLQFIEPSIEKVSRNKGYSERRLREMLEKHNITDL